jgi:hypothetical protein
MKFSLCHLLVTFGLTSLPFFSIAQCPVDSIPDMRYDVGNGDFAYIDNVALNGNYLSLASSYQAAPPSYQQHYGTFAEMEINIQYGLSGYIPYAGANVYVLAWIDGNNDGFTPTMNWLDMKTTSCRLISTLAFKYLPAVL